MISSLMKPPRYNADVRIGSVVSVVPAGGSLFPIGAANDATSGVAVVFMTASMALSVTAGVGDTEAATGVAAVSATMVVGTGVRVISIGEAVALGRGVGVRVAVAVACGVNVGA